MIASQATRTALCWLWLVSTALVCRAVADSPAQVTRGPARDPDPLVYDAALWDAVPREMLTEHEACYLFSRDEHEMLADGKARVTHHFIARVNNRSGLELLGDWPLSFDASCEQVVLNTARVHKPDGGTIEVSADDLHVRDDNTDFFEFDDYKNVIVTLSQLAVGDVIEVKYTRNMTDPQFAHHYFDSCRFSHDLYPIHRSELVVRLPAGQQLKFAACGEVPRPTRETTDETVAYRWRMENVPPFPPENDLPHDNGYAPLVDFSTFRSWEELGRAIVRLRGDRDECTPDIRRQVEQIIAGKRTPLQRTRALAQWCRDQVRYVSIHHGAFGFRPHTPARVFAKRYGNCNDVCQLLSVMLREAGVEAEFVFLNTDAEVQVSHEVPSPMAEHVILLVEIDGRQHWIDPTAGMAAWNELRGDLCGRTAFGLKDGRLRLLVTPQRRPEQFKIQQQTEVDLSIVGDAHWQVERRYEAQAAEEWRTYLAALTPDRRKPETFGDYPTFYPAARLEHRKHFDGNLTEVDDPLLTTFAFDVPRQMSEDGEERMLETVSPLLHEYFATAVEFARERPLRVDACEVVEQMIVRLPVAYELTAIAEEGAVQSKWGSVAFRASADFDLHAIKYEWRAKLYQGRVESEELAAYSRFLDETLNLAFATCWFDHPQQLGDAQLAALRRVIRRRPLDAEAAAIVIDALRYAGEEEEAAAALGQALEAAPDAAVLWEHKAGGAVSAAERAKILAEMTRRWPDSDDYRLLLADAYLSLKQYDRAVETAGAMRHQDFDTFCRSVLLAGRALMEKRDYKSALKRLVSAKALDPDEAYADALTALEGTIYLRLGRSAEAAVRFNEVLEFDPQHPEALAGALRLALARDDGPAARALLRRYLGLAELSPELRVEAAGLCLSAGRLDDAADLAEAAFSDDQQDSQAAAALILARAARKEYRQALAVPREGVEAPEVFAALLESSLAAGDHKTARAIAAAAREAARGHAGEPGAAALRRQLERLDAQPAGTSK